MNKFGTGQAVRRREDIRFVTGEGCYTDDLTMDRQARTPERVWQAVRKAGNTR